jgi:hypothetical protein
VILVSKNKKELPLLSKELAIDRFNLFIYCVLDYLDSPFFLRGSRIDSSFSNALAQKELAVM